MGARRAGVLVFVLLLAVLAASAWFAALALRGEGGVQSATVLVFEVPSHLEESVPPPGPYSTWLRPTRPMLWRVVLGLRQAARDDRVRGLVLHVGDLEWGWAKVAEVRDALQAFQAAGKPVYAVLSGGGDLEYLLASVADRIGATPLTTLRVDGLTASALFLRGALDKLDIKPNFAHSGTYKSGVEGYTRKDMSAPAREALQTLLDDLYETMVDSIATARGFSAEQVAGLLDAAPFDPPTARARGLIDTVLYEPEMDSLATEADDARNTMDFEDYLDRASRGAARSRIALVLAAGAIAKGRSRGTPGEGAVLGSETLIKALREARERDAVDAIVLRIDSPGGAADASDEIWREVDRCREEKPVVASLSDYAASGGYYIAVGADTIVAQPATVTGSIGVFGGKLNILGLYRKLGLNVETVSRGRHAEMWSPFRDFSDEEARRFQEDMDHVYATFLSRVAQGRGLEDSEVRTVAEGRVWSGLAAQERALVDELGGLTQALDIAKVMAGLPKTEQVAVEVYPRDERTFLQRLFSGLVSEDDEERLLDLLPGVRSWRAVLEGPLEGVLTMLPYRLVIR